MLRVSNERQEQPATSSTAPRKRLSIESLGVAGKRVPPPVLRSWWEARECRDFSD
jgi:hypothetical protein